jgi:6-pyruvoyltetrahydropterin/6-carboxytetrahydropterin synthase
VQIRIELTYRFEAAHQLPKVPPGHPCGTMHGHSYVIGIALIGTVDPELGWVEDFGDINARVAPIVAQLDHKTLNTVEGLANPTSELLARWLWQRIGAVVAGLVEVSVQETVHSRCVYTGG